MLQTVQQGCNNHAHAMLSLNLKHLSAISCVIQSGYVGSRVSTEQTHGGRTPHGCNQCDWTLPMPHACLVCSVMYSWLGAHAPEAVNSMMKKVSVKASTHLNVLESRAKRDV